MKPILISFIFLCSSLQCISQADSIMNLPSDSIKSWLENHFMTDHKDYPVVSRYVISINLSNKNYEEVANLHSDLSFWNYINYEVNGFDSIKHHRIKQIHYDSIEGNNSKMGKGYLDLAIDYLNDNQLLNAQNTLFQSIKVFEALGDQLSIAEAHVSLAYVYLDMNEPEKALYFANLSLPIFIKEKDHFLIADVNYSAFSQAYFILEDYEAALQSINQCINTCTKNEFLQREEILIEAYVMKGKILIELGQFEKAKTFLQKAWKLDIKNNGPAIAERIRYNIGEVLYAQEKYMEALPHLIAGTEALEEQSDFDPNALVKTSQCYEKLGLYSKALYYRIKSIDLQNKITDNNIASLETEALVKYETGRKDQELLEQEKTIQQKNRIQWLSIGAALLFAILLSTLFFFFRKNKKTSALLRSQNKIIEERNQQNEVLLKEIHHRVKNNLQVISSLLNFQSRSIDNKKVKTALLDSQSRVQSMSLIHQKLYRGKDLAAIEMKSYLGILSESLIDAYADEDIIKVKIDMEPLELDVDYAIPLGLIANELVTNSLKYAFPNDQKGSIEVRLTKQDDSIMLEIADDGVGQSGAKKPTANDGFGSELIEMLSLQLKGELLQTSESGFHTQFKFPYWKAA